MFVLVANLTLFDKFDSTELIVHARARRKHMLEHWAIHHMQWASYDGVVPVGICVGIDVAYNKNMSGRKAVEASHARHASEAGEEREELAP